MIYNPIKFILFPRSSIKVPLGRPILFSLCGTRPLKCQLAYLLAQTLCITLVSNEPIKFNFIKLVPVISLSSHFRLFMSGFLKMFSTVHFPVCGLIIIAKYTQHGKYLLYYLKLLKIVYFRLCMPPCLQNSMSMCTWN